MKVRGVAAADIEALAPVWHEAWHDAHGTLAPNPLVAARTETSFRDRLAEHLAAGSLFVVGDPAVGFVNIEGNEVEQMMLARCARGSGAATSLMSHAKELLREGGYRKAWLHCARGNERARRFYERHGWHVTMDEDSRLDVEGETFIVPCWRMEIEL